MMRQTKTGRFRREKMAVEFGKFLCEQGVDQLIRTCHSGRIADQEREREGPVEKVAEGEKGTGGGRESEDEKGGEKLVRAVRISHREKSDSSCLHVYHGNSRHRIGTSSMP